jgi:hypothetical protein
VDEKRSEDEGPDAGALRSWEEKWLGDAEKRSEAAQAEAQAAVSMLRETAKWIIGGVAVATGGIIAGSSLSSIGSLGLEQRLLVAFCAATGGFTALALLLWSAIDVVAPRPYDIDSILRGETVPLPIFERVQATMRDSIRDLAREHHALADSVSCGDVPIDKAVHDELTVQRILLRQAGSAIRFEHSRALFQTLTRRLFGLAPVIALCFGIFAWAANPPKDNPVDVPPMVKEIAVNPNDAPAIRKAMAAPNCVDSILSVVVLREWRSGSQEVLTVPSGACSPVRLRLDHGRLSPMD